MHSTGFANCCGADIIYSLYGVRGQHETKEEFVARQTEKIKDYLKDKHKVGGDYKAFNLCILSPNQKNNGTAAALEANGFKEIASANTNVHGRYPLYLYARMPDPIEKPAKKKGKKDV